MEERIGLLRDCDSGVFTIEELCRRYGVHRDTFYFWKARRESGGDRWWEDKSHASGHCPHATPEAVAARIIAVRRRFPHFGPKKIKAWLEREKRRLGVDVGQDQREGVVGAGLHGREDVGERGALVGDAARTLAAPPPHMAGAAFLADPRLIPEEDAHAPSCSPAD